jgi:hypothetical protein
MEKSKSEKRERFDRKFAAFVGKLPFPGRHTVGPAAVHALRTPHVTEKLTDRRRIAGFRLSNRMMTGWSALSVGVDACYLAVDTPPVDLPPAFIGTALALTAIVGVSSAASARAQSYLIERIDHSIEAAGGIAGRPWEVGVDQPAEVPVPYTERWPKAIERRDTLVHSAVGFSAAAMQLGIIAGQIMYMRNQ